MKNLPFSSLLSVVCLMVNIAISSCNRSDRFHNDSSDGFIALKYRDQTPLAEIVNPANYFEGKREFVLLQQTEVHVYGVGEISFDLEDSEKRYYLENDGFELYLRQPGPKDVTPERLWINHGTKSFGANGQIKCKWTKLKNDKYIAHLIIPLTELTFGLDQPRDSLGFNIAVADNDDGLIQKAKLSWKGSKEENLHLNFGWLSLKKTQIHRLGTYNRSKNFTDTIPDSIWHLVPDNKIENLVYGFVKDKFDLSASYKYLCDGEALYLRVEVLDSRQKTIAKSKIKERRIFVDYGWIENAGRDTIWEMHAKSSLHAGGGLKNQKVDTVLQLRPGKYFLYYQSDESHAPGSWTEPPPLTSFYGISLYKN